MDGCKPFEIGMHGLKRDVPTSFLFKGAKYLHHNLENCSIGAAFVFEGEYLCLISKGAFDIMHHLIKRERQTTAFLRKFLYDNTNANMQLERKDCPLC